MLKDILSGIPVDNIESVIIRTTDGKKYKITMQTDETDVAPRREHPRFAIGTKVKMKKLNAIGIITTYDNNHLGWDMLLL